MSDAANPNPVTTLLEKLGYTFKNEAFLTEALTHRSYVNESAGRACKDNERYEFLGDAVLDLLVSEELMLKNPEAREGDLSRLRASLVSEGALAKVAATIRLGDALRLGRGEALSGGRGKPSLIANAFEALLAAVYLDGGIEAARELLILHFDFPDPVALRGDPKTEIQQRIQADRHLTPTYRVVEETGPDHDKVFEVEVLVGGEVLGSGRGKTKKEAEQSAAAAVLAELDKSPANP